MVVICTGLEGWPMATKSRFLPDFDLSSSSPKSADYYGDVKDPRSLISHFLMAEIGLKLSNISEFTEVIDKVQQGILEKWTWNGNMFCVEIDRITCVITDFEAEPEDDMLNNVTMGHADFLGVLREWQCYVAKFSVPTY
jgi:hypothetical protein